MLHAVHGSSQARLHQTPSAQWPEAHSPSILHWAPFIFGPQLPPTHFWPVTQSASLAQVAKQTSGSFAPSHENGVHTVTGPNLQWRAPSQLRRQFPILCLQFGHVTFQALGLRIKIPGTFFFLRQ